MKMRRIWRYTAAALQLLCILLLWPRHCVAHPGGFWYGMYNTPGYAETFGILRQQYKMNWVTTGIMDASTFQALKDSGLRTINGPYFYDNYPHVREDSSKVGWYSYSFFLRLEAEGDTVAWQWNPDQSGGYIVQTSGERVSDTLASDSLAWCFDPARHAPGSVKIFRHADFTSKMKERIDLRYRIRGVPDTSSSPLASMILRKWNDSTLKFDTLAIHTILRSDISDNAYHEFPLQISTADQIPPWWTDIVLEWAGTQRLWVDWLGYDSPRGYDVVKPLVINAIKDFVQVYGFGGDPALLGFYMAEEIWSDGNIYPQKLIDSLIKDKYSNEEGWTEHHYLVWWDSRHQYGGRNAASYRLQKEKHHTWISYPFEGYNPLHKRVTPAGIIGDTTKYVSSTNPCQEGANTTCLQRTLDKVGVEFRFCKRFADSLKAGPVPGAGFVPFLQAKASWTRANPPNCIDTAVPWYEETRPPTDNEVRAQASMALANGANGLLYYVYGSVGEYASPATIKVPCNGDSAVITFNNVRQIGFIDLPGVQSALHNWVGPFVDSLGYFFADPNCHWKGGGRVDPRSDSIGLVTFFDSVKSLTFSPPDNPAYIEAGIYELAGYDYFFLANRRAYDAVPQTIRAWLNLDSAMYYIVDQYSKDTTLIGSSSGGSLAFTTSLNPGEGKLFKLVPLQSTALGSNQLRALLSGVGSGMHVVREVLSDGSLGDSTLTGMMPDGSTPFTATIPPNQSKSFKIFPGPDSISGGSFPATWQGGIRVGGNVTIAPGRPWTVLPPARICVDTGGDYSIDVRGNLVAEGTATDTIHFVAAVDSANKWNGITVRGAGDVRMSLAEVRNAYRGMWLWNTTDTITARIEYCQFAKHYLAGIAIDANPVSAISVAHSTFRDWGYYGVQIHQGKVDVDTNRFVGGGLNGVRVDGAYQYAVTGGHIRENIFESLQHPNATGVYIYAVRDDGLGTNEYLLQNNIFRNWTAPSGTQVGIQIINCFDELRFLRNAVLGHDWKPSFGVLSDGTTIFMYGDLAAPESLSAIRGTGYGIYSFSGITHETNYPFVRKCSFKSDTLLAARGYDIYVTELARINLGVLPDSGLNAFHGNCRSSSGVSVYTVYNTNPDSVLKVRAHANYWDGYRGAILEENGAVPLEEDGALEEYVCSYGWLDYLSKLGSNPFTHGLAKIVSLSEDHITPKTAEFGHLANYPNPFNASTVLSFALANPGPVEVAVYNVLGQRVRIVCKDDRGAGEHQVLWDGRDDQGRPVSTGVYFYTVTSGGNRLSKSIVLLK